MSQDVEGLSWRLEMPPEHVDRLFGVECANSRSIGGKHAPEAST
jgi:hypothetical protein